MLTDEERLKIYEEEKARLEAKEKPRRSAFAKGDWRWLLGGGLVLLLIVVCSLLPKQTTWTAPTSTASRSQDGASASYGPQLELVSFRWGRSGGGGYAKAEGQVTNITRRSLEGVAAVVTFKDKNGGFITSEDALIDYNPILSQQTSPFSVMATWNPAMRNGTAHVEFKYLMGGTIATREKAR